MELSPKTDPNDILLLVILLQRCFNAFANIVLQWLAWKKKHKHWSQLACMYLNIKFHGSHLLHRLGIPGLGASLELLQSHSQPGGILEEKGFNMRSWRSFGNALVVSCCDLTLNLGKYWRKEKLEKFLKCTVFFVNTNMLDRKGVYKCTGCLVRHFCIHFLLYHIVYWMAWQCTFLPLKWSPPKYEFEKYFKINYFEWGKGKGRKSSRFRGHMTVSFVL